MIRSPWQSGGFWKYLKTRCGLKTLFGSEQKVPVLGIPTSCLAPRESCLPGLPPCEVTSTDMEEQGPLP